MSTTRILTIQDVSCYGQCSLTVALPILSAMGIETCILPSAILSTHTGGFKGFTFRDLTDDMPSISAHWTKENIKFDTFYTGYVGSTKQLKYIKDIFYAQKKENSLFVVDPVMADNGKLYVGFDENFPAEMAKLCAIADVIVPNLTEASFLLGEDYVERGYDKTYIENLVRKLSNINKKNVVLTGVSFEQDKLGVAAYDRASDTIHYYFRNRIPDNFHGTGDVYASALVGALTLGKSLFDAADLAVDYTVRTIEETYDERKEHWYGVKFEKAIPYLIERMNK